MFNSSTLIVLVCAIAVIYVISVATSMGYLRAFRFLLQFLAQYLIMHISSFYATFSVEFLLAPALLFVGGDVDFVFVDLTVFRFRFRFHSLY